MYNFISKNENVLGKVRMAFKYIGYPTVLINELFGTKYDNTKNFVNKYKEDGIIWYFDNCELSSEQLIRTLWKLKDNGYFVTFLVPEEGRILEELEAEGIDYIVDNSLYGNDEWIKYACNYDIIFLSTIIMGQKIQRLNVYEKKIVWWIHEAPEFYKEIRDKIVLDNCENLSVFCDTNVI